MSAFSRKALFAIPVLWAAALASAEPRLKRVGGKIRAGDEELAANPRARSSVLRVALKVRA